MTRTLVSNFLTNFSPLFFLLLSILSPSVFPFSLSSTCLRNVSEQHKRTKAWQEEEEEEEREKGGRKLREVKERQKGKWGNGGKEWAERERLRGAEHGWVDLNAERCFVITCWHAASHTFQSSLSSPLWTARTQDGWGCRCATLHDCLFDSAASDAFLVVSW